MKPATVLPESYILYGDFEPRKFVRARSILIISGILLAALLVLLSDRIFPNLDPAVGLAWRSISVFYRYALFILCFYALLFLHECTHAFFIWMFSGKWPQIKVVKLWGISVGGYNASPGWYYPRNVFIIFALAPLFLVSSFLYVLSYRIPPVYVLPVQDIFLLNIVGSIQDVIVAFFAALHPVSALITWDGKIYHPRSEAGGKATGWRERLRSFLEHLVSRVG
jgi:Putative zincin peptidase